MTATPTSARLADVMLMALSASLGACNDLPPCPGTPVALALDSAHDGSASCSPIVVRDQMTWTVEYPCGAPKIAPTLDRCERLCGATDTWCEQVNRGDAGQPAPDAHSVADASSTGDAGRSSTGAYAVQCGIMCRGGRRPSGFTIEACEESVGGWFGSLAMLEHASVSAFEHLKADLVRIGAPRDILQAIDAAKHDEVRHTSIMTLFARAWGHEPSLREIERTRPKSLFETAVENAVEGCVLETYGAAIARLQSAQADASEIAEVMLEVAIDEERHAALSWRIHEWLMPQLTEQERSTVLDAMAREIETVRHDVNFLDDVSRGTLGLPSPSQTVAIVGVLSAQIWSPALAAA